MARLNHLTARGLETQRLLGDVLMQLMAETDYDKISVKDITTRAGVDRTTFYLHFQGKDDLLLKTQRRVIDDLFIFGKASDRPNPLATLAFEHMAQHPGAYQAILKLEGNARFSAQLQGHLEEILVPWIEELLPHQRIQSQAELHMLTGFILGALRGIAGWWLQAGMPFSAQQMGSRFVQLLRGGFAGLYAAPAPSLGHEGGS